MQQPWALYWHSNDLCETGLEFPITLMNNPTSFSRMVGNTLTGKDIKRNETVLEV